MSEATRIADGEPVVTASEPKAKRRAATKRKAAAKKPAAKGGKKAR